MSTTLSIGEEKILNCLDAKKPISIYQICALTEFSPSYVYSNLKIMECKKLVKCVKSHRRVLWFKAQEV